MTKKEFVSEKGEGLGFVTNIKKLSRIQVIWASSIEIDHLHPIKQIHLVQW